MSETTATSKVVACVENADGTFTPIDEDCFILREGDHAAPQILIGVANTAAAYGAPDQVVGALLDRAAAWLRD